MRLGLALALGSGCAVVAGAALSAVGARAARPTGSGLAVLSSLERPHMDARPKGPGELYFDLARNECRGAFLAPLDSSVPLRVESDSIAGVTLTAQRVGRLELQRPSGPDGHGGRWPDPLFPLDPALKLPSEAFLSPPLLWVDACAEASAEPGQRRGSLVVDFGPKRAVRVPVRIRVRGFALPSTRSLRNTFGFSGLSAVLGEELKGGPSQVRQRTAAYARAALAHGLSLHGMTMEPPPFHKEGGRMVLDFRDYDQELAPFLDGTALPSGAKFNTTDLRTHPLAKTDDEKVAYWRELAQHLRERGWLERAFAYAYDEPAPSQLPALRHFAELVHRAAPELRVIATTTLTDALAGAVDVWVPNLLCLFSKPLGKACERPVPLEGYASERATGRELWWYPSCMSHGCSGERVRGLQAKYLQGWPDYVIDMPAARQRALGVLAFRYGLDGQLYYNIVDAYNHGNPYRHIYQHGGNGDGTLFYPALTAGGPPVQSLRLKTIRDGLEDYEYFQLAATRGFGDQARRLAQQLVPASYLVEERPEAWAKALCTLADLIDADVE